MKEHPLYITTDESADETILLERITSGDERAFSALYQRYWKKVFTYLLRLTKSRETAEELLSEIFTRFWINRAVASSIENVDAFLSKVTYNRAIDFFRFAAKEKKIQALIALELNRYPSQINDGYLLEKEYKALLREAIHQLPPQRKLVFTLSREQGLTHEEIARRLNMSPHTVKKTMSNAIKSIRTFLRKQGVDGMILDIL
ncbi:RNA polymerase sigma factor [Chitinophaga eiseniae]|uniref:RNA polymerase sigma-70 factor n=1 Tax=Chitinophaga eiseniae TaxID=634771 RepID=A0A847SKZ7_9BACT|nr:RNA polymerase sigma-70 factor [Chitinophaga eiseniae]NLR78238.1 RNA polymerase sigma-70 factor [Chitinophaga eiseniae]